MRRLTRRQFAGALSAVGAQFALKCSAQAATVVPTPRFGFENVVQRARDLALAPFDPAVPSRLPEPFDALDFDTWREFASGATMTSSPAPTAASGWRRFISAFSIAAR